MPSRPLISGRPSVRIATRATSTATKLTPFRKKASATPKAAMSNPATAGPTMRVRELEHEPGLRHALHPRPDLRDQLADPEQSEVSMPQGTQTHRPSRRREPCDPFGGFRSLGH